MKKVLLLAVTLSLAAIGVNAQRTCGTTEMVKKSLQMNPGAAQRMQDLEDFTQNYTPTGERAVKIIPVVVHIIHNYGPENISKEQVLDAIRILNEDFQLRNDDTTQIVSQFKNIKGAPNFEFRLAQIDPSGNCTDGITRTVSDLTFSADDNVKDLIRWPSNKYYNIWVVDAISFGAGGYAYYPGSTIPQYEGVVCLNSQFGSIGMSNGSNFSARTLTHETGHYFNLKHTWGDNNDCGSGSCGSDNVSDTPTTEGNCLTCNVNKVSCGSLDNVQNYMDYATCTYMFTQGQATRMLAAANSSTGSRNSLWQNANLIATGVNDGYVDVCAPVADFLYEPGTACVSELIEFTDISYNASVDNTWLWNWSFPGADSLTSNLQNPVISYSTPGVYNVTLTVTNSAGTDAITRNQIITIKPSVGLAITPLEEGFEDVQFPVSPVSPLLNWTIESPAVNSWQRVTNAFVTGDASVKIAAASLAAGTKHSLISPVVDVSDATTSPLTMQFKVAYRYDGTNADVLKLMVSDNCGATWITRYTKAAASLSTVNAGTALFTPVNETEWRTETVNINNIAGKEGVLFKFELTAAGGGNNLFIDDINIDGQKVGLEEMASNGAKLNVFPNPITSQSQIMFSGVQSGKATLSVFDITGRQMALKTIATQANIANTYMLSDVVGNTELPVGIYNIRLQQGNAVLNKRLVVAQ